MSVDLGRNSTDASTTPKASTDLTSTPQKPIADVPPENDAGLQGRMDRVLLSDIGINTLLARLKQSISSAREFSGFLKERAALEEKHSHGMNRLTRITQDVIGRPENRQGSFALNYREIGSIQEKMAKNSEDFAHGLLAMSDELQEMAAHCERGRKQWKHTGLEAEQRSQDADSAMEKAKQRYHSFADQYDRVRTGERQGGKFGLKGPKSAAQQEENLLSKAENADQEYRSRVEAAQAQRHELHTSSRPQATRELKNLILECDAAVSMQLQKFAVLNEKLLLGNGLCVSPLKGQESTAASGSSGSSGSRSLREVAQAINNQKDFEDFVLSHNSKVGPTPAEIRYEKHPAFNQPPQQHHQPQLSQSTFNTPSRSDTGFNNNNNMGGPPPRSETGFNNLGGPPARTDTGFKSLGGPPHRTDTGFDRTGGPMNQGGQTSGIVSNHSPRQGSYPTTQSSVVSSAPQLPQIGALSSGGRTSLEGGHAGVPHGRGDNRDFAGAPQHRAGQPSYSGPPNYSPTATVNQQVTSGPGQTGVGAGPGMGRGQPQAMGGPSYNGPQSQGPYQGMRGPSLGQQNDFRQDGRGPQQGSGYPAHQSDPRGLPSQTNNFGPSSYGGPNSSSSPPVGGPTGGARAASGRPNLPPLRPVFGVPLDELFRRDGAAVPAIVYQCAQAVDLFGLTTEGVYRVSGSAQHVMELRALFDHDSSQVDFRNRAAFYNDIASVTTLLKHFLRDLPDPLLTSAQYNSFIQASKLEDDIVRRDSLHAIINSLPDPNYATLRTLVLHLNRVAQNSAQNRMTASNIAIVFGPTLMGGHGGGPSGEIQDAGWQARVVETILNNTMQIFDDDD